MTTASSNHRTVYQLFATGNSMNGWRFKMKSKVVFTQRSDAEAYYAEFRDKCFDASYFDCAFDDEAFRITIIELDLYD